MPSVRLAPVPSHTIPGEPLPLTPEVREWVAEALRELGLEARQPPAMWLIEFEDLRARRVVDDQGHRHLFGMYAHTRGEEPVIALQRGLPDFLLRWTLRHELRHWKQDIEGRGHWWSGVTTRGEPIEGLWVGGDEREAERFAADARYEAELAAAATDRPVAPAGYRWVIGRRDGRFGWQLCRQLTFLVGKGASVEVTTA